MMKKHTALLIALLFFGFLAHSQNTDQEIKTFLKENQSDYTTFFKDLHQHPELGFQETRTAKIVAEALTTYGYSVSTGIGKTGIAAVLKNGNGPTVMYRADMDALPVQETTGLDWASTKKVEMPDGSESFVGHMCGHDAHITWLLQAAQYMAQHQKEWKGTLVFIAQPAEEMIEGARAMFKDGLYSTYKIPIPDYYLGMHSSPLPRGTVIAAAGKQFAGTDQFDITFHGVGGHGSAPEKAKDPVVMAANAIMQYQTIISRDIDPQDKAVLTVGSVQAGTTNNVIPNEAMLKVNLRWFNEKDRELMKRKIDLINKGIAARNELSKEQYPTVKDKGWASPLDNDQNLTTAVRQYIKPVLGNAGKILDENDVKPLMGSEDFHHLVSELDHKVPYTYLMVGVADPKRYQKSMEKTEKPPYYNHNGDYEVTLEALPLGGELAIHSLLGTFGKEK